MARIPFLIAQTVLAVACLCPGALAESSPSMQKASAYMNSGHFSQAVSLLVQGIRQAPSDLELRRQLCQALIGAGQAHEALKQLDVIAQVSPADSRDLNLRALASEQLGDAPKAAAYFRQAIAKDPLNAESRVGLARTLVSQGNLKEAREVCYLILRSGADGKLKSSTMQLLEIIRNRAGMPRGEDAKA